MSNADISIWQVDAFTSKPFGGNPAAICILPEFPSDEWMQDLAGEMNLSETAFLVRESDRSTYQLRWFTPNVEVDLCGHATLASAHVLWEQGLVAKGSEIRFQTRSGELVCSQSDRGITLDFPASDCSLVDDEKLSSDLKSAFGITKATVYQTAFDLMMVVQSGESVMELRPNYQALKDIPTRGVIVTSQDDRDGIDFVSRFFAPRCGIDEDPVTGSAHCCLAPYWSKRLGINPLVGHQASRRGGMVRCEVDDARVLLTGDAVTVLEGRLMISLADLRGERDKT
ncbi:PhzF family phenazine biosynthesis protein [Rhodopirellula baltica]|uniref:PhzF family phenazine biosynthesis protein n=1 Tax=Rhodopirellula baltica SWK14 TaxID=993516 RepID=L7CDJ4_RHOBT|nr:PhzF family phenazine biosynthesis protein [Rhodopirellula baltica]ELP31166.1 PhzF family phenazine biosynthesis protein [Rhodopirellula baltica SWK14]